MTEIGVERLGAGDGEKDRAQRDETDLAVVQQEHDRVERIEGEQDLRPGGHMGDAGDRDHHEPQHHDGAEEGRDLGGAARLHRKQHDQDRHGQGHDVGVEGGRGDLETFDRGQDRERRRDHGVAVEQRRADDAAQRDDIGAPAQRALRQRHQGERSALPVVVGPQQHDDVFERDGDDQRPQDERQDAEYGRRVHRAAGLDGGGDRLAQRIERAGADVAVDDADAADREAQEGGLEVRGAVPVERNGRGRGAGRRH